MPTYFYESVIGRYYIKEEHGFITRVCFQNDVLPEDETLESPLIKEAQSQLNAYFTKKLQVFSLPLAPEGTPYMKKIWEHLCQIPYGETASYSEIAERAGNPKAARAVGLANNKNPIPIIIPCHRVVGKNGKLVGYRGGLDMKELLLNLEQKCIRSEAP